MATKAEIAKAMATEKMRDVTRSNSSTLGRQAKEDRQAEAEIKGVRQGMRYERGMYGQSWQMAKAESKKAFAAEQKLGGQKPGQSNIVLRDPKKDSPALKKAQAATDAAGKKVMEYRNKTYNLGLENDRLAGMDKLKQLGLTRRGVSKEVGR